MCSSTMLISTALPNHRSGAEFRLVNKQEIEDDPAQAFPEAYHTLYHRQDAAS